jgi:hypothetical protein
VDDPVQRDSPNEGEFRQPKARQPWARDWNKMKKRQWGEIPMTKIQNRNEPRMEPRISRMPPIKMAAKMERIETFLGTN